MENFDKNIDQIFSNESKKAEENTSFPGFETVWEKIENRLNETDDKPKKTLIPIWLPYSIAASLVFVFGLIYFVENEEVKSNSSSVALNDTVNSNMKLDTVELANLDQEIKQNIKQNSSEKISRKDNPAEIELNSSKVLASNIITNTQIESQKQDNLLEINDVNENDKMLSKSASSPIISEDIAQDSERIIETQKYRSTETAKMAFNEQKTSEQLSALAEQPTFADNTDVNDDDDFKISKKHSNEPLYIVDGYVADSRFLKNYNKKKITSLNIVEGSNAKKLYGNYAKKGVVVITTKGLNSQEEEYLKRNSKNYNFSGAVN